MKYAALGLVPLLGCEFLENQCGCVWPSEITLEQPPRVLEAPSQEAPKPGATSEYLPPDYKPADFPLFADDGRPMVGMEPYAGFAPPPPPPPNNANYPYIPYPYWGGYFNLPYKNSMGNPVPLFPGNRFP